MAHGHDDRELEKGSGGSRDSGGSLDGSCPGVFCRAGPTRAATWHDPASGDETFRVAMPAGVSAVGTARRSLVGLDRNTDEYVVLG